MILGFNVESGSKASSKVFKVASSVGTTLHLLGMRQCVFDNQLVGFFFFFSSSILLRIAAAIQMTFMTAVASLSPFWTTTGSDG
jgi:hypothetical protein